MGRIQFLLESYILCAITLSEMPQQYKGEKKTDNKVKNEEYALEGSTLE